MPAAGKWREQVKEKQGKGEGRRWKTSWLFPSNLHHLNDLLLCGAWLG